MRQLVCALVVIFLFTMYISGCTYKNNETSDELQMESLRVLREVLHHQNEWVKVHAAEFLLWTGYPEEVKEIYLSEEKIYGEKPQYRIGIWRVLAQAADSDVEKKIVLIKFLPHFWMKTETIAFTQQKPWLNWVYCLWKIIKRLHATPLILQTRDFRCILYGVSHTVRKP